MLSLCNPICTSRMTCCNRTELELCSTSRTFPATTADQKQTAERLQICGFYKSCSTGIVMMQGHKSVLGLMEYKGRASLTPVGYSRQPLTGSAHQENSKVNSIPLQRTSKLRQALGNLVFLPSYISPHLYKTRRL